MKKMNKILTILLALMMVLALVACGGNSGNSGDSANSTNSANSGSEQANDNPYNLDYKSADLQPMTSERASKEALVEAEEYYVHGLSSGSEEVTKQTYADMAAHIGVDASEFQYFESWGQCRYTWYLEGSEGASLLAVFTTDGSLYSVTSSVS